MDRYYLNFVVVNFLKLLCLVREQFRMCSYTKYLLHYKSIPISSFRENNKLLGLNTELSSFFRFNTIQFHLFSNISAFLLNFFLKLNQKNNLKRILYILFIGNIIISCSKIENKRFYYPTKEFFLEEKLFPKLYQCNLDKRQAIFLEYQVLLFRVSPQ